MAEAGRQYGVSRELVRQAAKLLAARPDTFAVVKAGQISLRQAQANAARDLRPGVRFTFMLSYQQPSDKSRVRGLKSYARESKKIYRGWTLNLGPESLEFDDYKMGQEVGMFIFKALKKEGYPVRTRRWPAGQAVDAVAV